MSVVINYIIEASPHMVSHPRIYKVSSISGVEVSKNEVSFLEASLAEPALFLDFISQFKAYITDFSDSIDSTAGVDAINEEKLRSFEKGISYASNHARNSEN